MSEPGHLRERIIEMLDAPRAWPGITLNLGLLALIYASVGLLVFELRYPEAAAKHEALVGGLNNVILFLFFGDLMLRLVVYRERLKYLLSPAGAIDVLAVLPGLLALVIPGLGSIAWIRVLRIVRVLRFIRLLKVARHGTRVGTVLGGVVQKLLPWVALAAGLKGVVLAAEATDWWPGIGDLGVVITVAGFAISVLLGAKLSVVQTRFYDVEDAICRIIGAVTDMKRTGQTAPALNHWVGSFRRAIAANTPDSYRELKRETGRLEQVLEAEGVGGPVTAGFHKDVEFVVHRLRARTPLFLERFLRYVTIVYAATAVLAIPGFTGFFSVALIIFVLGGMYFLIDDMDNPLADGSRSLLSIDLTPLEEYRSLDDAHLSETKQG